MEDFLITPRQAGASKKATAAVDKLSTTGRRLRRRLRGGNLLDRSTFSTVTVDINTCARRLAAGGSDSRLSIFLLLSVSGVKNFVGKTDMSRAVSSSGSERGTTKTELFCSLSVAVTGQGPVQGGSR